MESLKGKRLLILGGNLEKEDIKKFAIDNGVTLIAAGNNPKADYCKIADEYYNINSIDSEKMLSFISEQKIDGVYLGGNETVITYATKYLENTSYPCYCTSSQWHSIQNKGMFKKLCMEAGLPVATRYNNIEDVHESDYPVITKPVDGAGSCGFSVCTDYDSLVKGYKLAKENSLDGEALIEKFLPNNGIVVIYTFSNGKMYFSGMENKTPVHYSKQGSYVAGLHLFESRYASEFREKFENKLEKMFKSIDIKEGTIWMEVFHTNGEYFFNEAGYRYSGSSTPYPVDYFKGINQVYSDLIFSLTGKSHLFDNASLIPEHIERNQNYCILPVHMNSGMISAVNNQDKIESMNNVVKVINKKYVGSFVEDSGTVDQVFCFIHFVFSSKEVLIKTITDIYDTLTVLDENGENMLVNKLDFNNINF